MTYISVKNYQNCRLKEQICCYNQGKKCKSYLVWRDEGITVQSDSARAHSNLILTVPQWKSRFVEYLVKESCSNSGSSINWGKAVLGLERKSSFISNKSKGLHSGFTRILTQKAITWNEIIHWANKTKWIDLSRLYFAPKSNEIDRIHFVFVIPKTKPCETGETEIPFWDLFRESELRTSTLTVLSRLASNRKSFLEFVWNSK